LKMLDHSILDPTKLHHVSLPKIWVAGAVGGLASWVVSAPSELIKCRTQLHRGAKTNSLIAFKHVWERRGLRGLYLGGVVTGVRDSVGYGFYFFSYELCRRLFAFRHATPETHAAEFDVLVSGGIAGIVTWVSIYPLDVIKTRIQVEGWKDEPMQRSHFVERGTLAIAKRLFEREGLRAFYSGSTVCSVRAFFVNAIQVLSRPSDVASHMLTSRSGTLTKRLWHISRPSIAIELVHLQHHGLRSATSETIFLDFTMNTGKASSWSSVATIDMYPQAIESRESRSSNNQLFDEIHNLAHHSLWWNTDSLSAVAPPLHFFHLHSMGCTP
jgi:Mitochondrial carrier protein